MLRNSKIFLVWMIGLWMAGSAVIANTEVQAQGRQPAAEIIALLGDAEIKSPAESQSRKAKLQEVLYPQDQVRTLANSRAKLWFQDETVLMLAENTTVDISRFQMDNQGRRQDALFRVMEGTMRFIVHKFYPGLPPGVEVEGKTAIMGIRGTDCIIEVHSPDLFLNIGNTPVVVRDRATGLSIVLPPGVWARVLPGQPITTGSITPSMWRQYVSRTRSGQTRMPGDVSLPPILLPGERVVVFGNPMVPQDSPFRNLANPGINNQIQPPLPAIHHR